MAKKSEQLQRKQAELAALQEVSKELQASYDSELEKNPRYSLEVDPENKYKMKKAQKEFIRHYVQYKSVATAAELAGIDIDVAKKYFIAYNTQTEIRRLNMAMYHRQFSARLLSMDEIGGYLSSLLVDYNVPMSDRLKTGEKLQVVRMLIDLNQMKLEGLRNPQEIMNVPVEEQLKNLSIQTIKRMLTEHNKSKPIIQDYKSEEELSPEESAYLSTLPTSDLLQLIDDQNKEDNKHDAE